MHYADIMALKVDRMGHSQTVYEAKFEVTNEVNIVLLNICLFLLTLFANTQFTIMVLI